MADGLILIDSRIRTDGAKEGTQDLKNQLQKLADSASASAKKIDKSFDSISVDDAADGLSEAFEDEAQQVEQIPEEIEDEFSDIDLDDTAEGLSESFEDEAQQVEQIPEQIEQEFADMDLDNAAEGLADSFDEAWDEIKQDSAKGAERLKDQLDDIGDEAEEAGDKIEKGLGNKLKKVLDGLSDDMGEGFVGGLLGGITAGLTEGALDLLGNAGEALLELGKQSVVAAADVKAANAQFSQAFGSIEESARGTLQAIADDTGINATRLQTAFAQTYSYMKTLGAGTSDAMDLSSRAVRAAADQAAYYDKSIEDVTESLQSFIKGNYENDAALGIAATETTRNAKANELYAKSFQKLSESQKADVLLAMVEAGNAASGALGQAAREADNWANVTGNLSDAWHQLLGVIGEPILTGLTPVLQGVTEGLQGMTEGLAGLEVGQGFVSMLADGLHGLGETMGFVAPSAQTLWGIFGQMGLTATETAGSTNQLTVSEQDLKMATEDVAAQVANLRLEYDAARETARAALDSTVGLTTVLATESKMTATQIVDNWGKQKEALTKYGDNLEKLVDMKLPDALMEQLANCSQESMLLADELANTTELTAEEISAAFNGVEEQKTRIEGLVADVATGASEQLAGMAADIAAAFGPAAEEVGASIGQMQSYIDSLQGKDVFINVIMQTGKGIKGAGSGGGGLVLPNGATTASLDDLSSSTAIPYLASGAVIPPGAPFLAVLGDQRSGTNLEAPEGLIRDIFRQEMTDMVGGMMAGFEAMVEEQRATRSAIEDIQIGDTTIGRAAARYDRRQNLIRGGTTG